MRDLEELRERYQCAGFKKGTSLRLLIEEDKVLTQNQYDELQRFLGISTLEEFYQAYHSSNGLKVIEEDPQGIALISKSGLEKVAQTCEKYMTKEEAHRFRNFKKKFSTGAWNPKNPPPEEK